MNFSQLSTVGKANLGLRFLLEITAAAGYPLAFILAMDSGLKWLLAAVSAVGFWALWAVFATPNDPSRGGKAVVSTPGPLRLALELALFFGAAAMLLWAGLTWTAIVLAVTTVIHYALWPALLRWLLGL